MGVAVRRLRGHPHRLQQAGDPPPAAPRGRGLQTQGLESLADDVPHQHARVHGGDRVLEDDLEVLAVGPHAPVAQAREVLPLVVHRAAGGPEQLQQALADGGLAAAGLPHQGQGPAAVEGQGDPSTARTCPTTRRRMPPWMGKWTLSPLTEAASRPGRRVRGQAVAPAPGLDAAPLAANRRPHPIESDETLSECWRLLSGAKAGSTPSLGTQRWQRTPCPAGLDQRAPARRSGQRQVAAVGEAAAGEGLVQGRDPPGDHGQGLGPPRCRGRDALHEAPAVGVGGAGEEVGGAGRLHDLPGVHHRQPVGGLGHHPQVVGDEQDGHPGLALEALEQAQDLGLDGHVQGRGGLVGDEELRVPGQGHGDHDPLLHAPGELVGVLGHPPRRVRDADLVEQLQDPGGLRPVAAPVCRTASAIWAHGEHRVEGGLGLLEDHGHAPAAHLAHGALGSCSSWVSPSRTLPATTRPAGGSRRIRDRAVMDLPQPDSPSRAKVSPRRIVRSSPSTTRTGLSPLPRWVSRPSTRNRGGDDGVVGVLGMH